MSEKNKVAITVTAIAVISLVIAAYFILSPSVDCLCKNPIITVDKSTTLTATTWTITNISKGVSILKNNVYIQLRNESGLIIDNESLTTASGTHGFLYFSTTGITGPYISVGDIFSLSKDYAQGSTIALMPTGNSSTTNSQPPYKILIV
jgi:hypothetical protein